MHDIFPVLISTLRRLDRNLRLTRRTRFEGLLLQCALLSDLSCDIPAFQLASRCPLQYLHYFDGCYRAPRSAVVSLQSLRARRAYVARRWWLGSGVSVSLRARDVVCVYHIHTYPALGAPKDAQGRFHKFSIACFIRLSICWTIHLGLGAISLDYYLLCLAQLTR